MPEVECTEAIPMLRERIGILREVGAILCEVSGYAYSHPRK